ncbi:NUDIX hydrolase [Streptomyces sp. NPDC054771]
MVVQEARVLMVRRRVSEGGLFWQLPAGEVEPGKSRECAALREAPEETGLTVSDVKLLGDLTHPKTGRLMSNTACDVVSGTAHVAYFEELVELAWVTQGEIVHYVPHGLFEPGQAYLDVALLQRFSPQA